MMRMCVVGALAAAAVCCAGAAELKIDFTKPAGAIKPVHGVNNGPVRPMPGSHQNEFRAAGIPFMRTHDTHGMWGGSHYVDVPNVFPDFDADENDPKSYDFTFTDGYLKPYVAAGVKIFYRLGVTIENYAGLKRYTTNPPKDFAKWARVCEHIVRHYNKGWANGHRWNIEHWEIWNEPEAARGEESAMWNGTKEQFFELYRAAACEIKAKHPEVKVGGYGAMGFYAVDMKPGALKKDKSTIGEPTGDQKLFVRWFEDFCRYVTDPKTKAPFDFFGWHLYVWEGWTVDRIVTHAKVAREILDRHGLTATESYLDEWNDMNGIWSPRGKNPRKYSDLKRIGGAVSTAAAFALTQKAPLTGAMYYDALPTRSYCGLFTFPDVEPTATYAVFKAFSVLYRLGTDVTLDASPAEDVYAAAATCGSGRQAVYLVNAGKTPATLTLAFTGAAAGYDVTRLEKDGTDFVPAGEAKAGDALALPPMSVTLLRSRLDAVPKGLFSGTPKYPWRGYMLDCARHFFTVAEIKRTLDAMALVNLNVFHWHLTDDQGWRVPIDAYPKLVQFTRPAVMDRRKRTDLTFRDAIDGTYGPSSYTKDEIRDVIAYAAARGIRVVPEIELPGHAYAAGAMYPFLKCPGGDPESSDVCAGSPETVAFYEKVFDEVCALFPDEVVHIGGDECSMKNWKTCPRCQAFMKTNGMKDVKDLQGYLTKHFAAYLAKKGKRAMGWDEVVRYDDLPKNVIVMSYRGAKGGIAAAKRGYDVVMTPDNRCYLDYDQGLLFDRKEYQAFGRLVTALSTGTFDPCEGIPAEFHRHVLGGQGNCWTELMPTFEDVTWRSWPRMAGLADALWNGPTADEAGFARRLEAARRALEDRGLAVADVGPLTGAEKPFIGDVKPGFTRFRPETHCKMLACSLDEKTLVWEKGPVNGRQIAAVVVPELKKGEWALNVSWNKVTVEVSSKDDAAAVAAALKTLRLLMRNLEAGVLSFPTCRVESVGNLGR